MFRRERSIPLRGSAAALCNNLSVLQLPARNLTHFGVVHGPSAQLLSAAPEGVPLAQRQLHAKEGAGVSPPLITQIHWCVLPFRVLLVLTSHRGIQMYESDGSVMVYWHALDAGDGSLVQAVFARGIAASGHYVCVGEGAKGRALESAVNVGSGAVGTLRGGFVTKVSGMEGGLSMVAGDLGASGSPQWSTGSAGAWSGRVLVFDIPTKGPNIVLSEELARHQTPISDIATEPAQGQDRVADTVTADDSGLLCVWRSGPKFKLLTQIPGFGVPCSSVQLWQGTIAAGYGNGQVRLYEASTGTIHVQIDAHARAICALDLAPEVGKLLSAAEDTFVHIWKLSRSPEGSYIEVEHCHGECVPDTQLCGARFCDPSGSSFAVTGYDVAEILRFSSI